MAKAITAALLALSILFSGQACQINSNNSNTVRARASGPRAAYVTGS